MKLHNMNQNKIATQYIATLFFFILSIISINTAYAVNGMYYRAGDPIAGNANGKVTMVEFFDYQCGHCVDMAPVVSSLIKINPNLRVIFKEFPIRGPMSDYASRAALAANKQGKYYQFNHALFTANQDLTEEVILQIAKSVGLNIAKLQKDMRDPKINAQLEANKKLAQKLQIPGTPAFFIGPSGANKAETSEIGAVSQQDLQSAINKAGQL